MDKSKSFQHFHHFYSQLLTFKFRLLTADHLWLSVFYKRFPLSVNNFSTIRADRRTKFASSLRKKHNFVSRYRGSWTPLCCLLVLGWTVLVHLFCFVHRAAQKTVFSLQFNKFTIFASACKSLMHNFLTQALRLLLFYLDRPSQIQILARISCSSWLYPWVLVMVLLLVEVS